MKHTKSVLQVAVSVVVVLAFAAPPVATAGDAVKGASGNVIADSGFRPNPGGFAFENWGGDQYPYSDLTGNDAVALFGDRVCARFDGNNCVPTAAAKTWLEQMNEMMKGGHCEGMAALSAAFYVKQETPADFGGKEAFQLSPKDDALMSTISAYFATQALEPVQSVTSSTREWPLQKIVDSLVASLKSGKDYPTLGIYGEAGGHAVTPYKIEQLAPGSYRVFVYDNNYPGAEKYIDIDASQNRWSYAGAALNPSEDPAPWQGAAGDMDLTQLSVRYEPLTCPFCGSHQPPRSPAPKPPVPSHPRQPSKPSDSYSVITPSRCSQVQATRKKDKKQLSRGKNGAKNEIPGATMARLRGSRGCYVRLPANEQYDLALIDDGRPVTGLAQLFVFALGQVYGVSNLQLGANTSQSFSLGQMGFSYQAGGTQRPTIVYATDTTGPNAYYEVSGFEIHDGYSFNAETNDEGAVTFSDNDPDLDSFDIDGEVIGETATEEVHLEDLSASDKGEVELEVEDDGDVDVDIDSDADGTEDEKDLDDDNDGAPDASDKDDDNDGIADAQENEDEDHDGTPDALDADDDNDGTPDASDADDDNDGTPDAQDDDSADGEAAASADSEDTDHDGTPDASDADDDNDGTPDAQDADDDNDGAADAEEDEGAQDDSDQGDAEGGGEEEGASSEGDDASDDSQDDGGGDDQGEE
jgi:hypothetical protein